MNDPIKIAGKIYADLTRIHQCAMPGTESLNRDAFYVLNAARRVYSFARLLRLGVNPSRYKILRRELGSAIEAINLIGYRVKTVIDRLPETLPAPTWEDIYRDILALQQEEYDLQWCEGELVFTTKDINLEDENGDTVELGPMEVHIKFKGELILEKSIHVKAISPNRGPDGYFHPHVRYSGEVCFGDGKVPIANALAQGRIFDLITLINSVLTTYNPDSPYVKLERWGGEECTSCSSVVNVNDLSDCHIDGCEERVCSDCAYHCSDCGGTVCPGHRNSCSRCGDTVCDECGTECGQCGSALCQSCSNTCRECGDRFCDDCLNECSSCRKPICGNCISTCKGCGKEFCPDCGRDELCNKCRQAAEQEGNDESETEPVGVCQDSVATGPQ